MPNFTLNFGFRDFKNISLRVVKRAKAIKYMVIKGELTLSGEYTMQYTDNV